LGPYEGRGRGIVREVKRIGGKRKKGIIEREIANFTPQ